MHRLAVVGSLTTKLVHNLNNPLTLLNANLRQVSMSLQDGEATGELAELGTELVTEMSDAIAEIRTLINAISAYATSDQPARHVDLLEAAETAFAVAGIKARFAAELKLEAREGDDLSLHGRAAQLQQLIVCIVLHAVSQPGSYGPVRGCLFRDGDEVVFELVDDRPLALTAHVPDGSHHEEVDPEVGLLLARHIANDHGGKLAIDELPGGQPVYRVSLPAPVDAGASGAEGA